MSLIQPVPKEFLDKIKDLIEDERTAFDEYHALARTADGLGYYTSGAALRRIASDEHEHHVILKGIIKHLSWATEPMQLHRPFPQTYDDWADLGMDIAGKDPSLKDEVYSALAKIYHDEPSTDDAKRWLVGKAGELGIA